MVGSMKSILFILVLVLAVVAKEAPVYDYAYSINFDQAFFVNKTRYSINGQFFYDPLNNRERVDRTNGRYDIICGTVTPNQTTPCQQYTVDNKRWVIFPKTTQCCLCCDAEHGCGILRPDWLYDAQYLGQEVLLNIAYDKWSKKGDFGDNFFWAGVKNKIPRRIQQNQDHITDFNTNSFQNQTIPFADSIFALPSYCNLEDPSLCPVQSACGLFRARANLLAQQ